MKSTLLISEYNRHKKLVKMLGCIDRTPRGNVLHLISARPTSGTKYICMHYNNGQYNLIIGG